MNSLSDYKSPLIIDFGTDNIKIGISGQKEASLIFKNIISQSKDNNKLIGTDCINNTRFDFLKTRNIIQNGIFLNIDDIPYLFSYIYKKLSIPENEITEHPILISEPILNLKKNREKIANILFDNLNIPAISFASQPILSIFSTSLSNGLILDSGEGISQSCIIQNGIPIKNTYVRCDYGGGDVTNYLKEIFKNSGYSFVNTQDMLLLKKIKEKYCFVCSDENYPPQSEFNLSDNNIIKIGDEKVLCTELLFNPSLNHLKFLSFQEMIINSVNGFDIQLRRNIFQNIILFGGNTMFKGIQTRINKEIKKLTPKHTKIKILTFPKINNPVIKGGIFISSFSSFKDIWIMKNEFLDKGYNILHEKAI